MQTTARIQSVFHTPQLSAAITGIPSFELRSLHMPLTLDFELPHNLRLGHLVERVVAGALHAASNYYVVYENVQIKNGTTTLGELDFILQNKETKAFVHMELAYKFYLYDASISDEIPHNWIGPNRNDSLVLKLEKLQKQQFKLLHTSYAQAQLSGLEHQKVTQQLCLLANLFVPLGFDISQIPQYQHALIGYYMDFKAFLAYVSGTSRFYIPNKKEWGMAPQSALQWYDLDTIQTPIADALSKKQAPLVWIKSEQEFEQLFVVWW